MNSLVKFYRSQYPGTPLSDKEITLLYGDTAKPEDLAAYPDFLKEFSEFDRERRIENAPPLGEEALHGLQRGTHSLAGTAAGGAALLAGKLGATPVEKYFGGVAARQETAASDPDIAPTIRGIQDIRGAGDFLRYGSGAIGEVTPSIGEAAAIAGVGALAGGPVGIGEGFILRQAARSIAKKGVEEVIAANAIKGIGKAALESEIKSAAAGAALDTLNPITVGLLEREGRAVAAKIGQHIATGVNSYGLSSGEIYNDLIVNRNVDPDVARNTALLFGAVGAIPDTFLPGAVTEKLFPGVAHEKSKEYVKRLLHDAAKDVPLEALTEGFQEAVGIAAKKYADPTQRDKPFSKDELLQIVNASALGAVGGALAAPISAAGHESGPGDSDKSKTDLSETGTTTVQPPPPAANTTISPPAPPAPPAAPGIQLDPNAQQVAANYTAATTGQLNDLGVIAQRELAGTPAASDAAVIATDPAAYAIAKGQVLAQQAKAGPAPAVAPTVTETVPVAPVEEPAPPAPPVLSVPAVAPEVAPVIAPVAEPAPVVVPVVQQEGPSEEERLAALAAENEAMQRQQQEQLAAIREKQARVQEIAGQLESHKAKIDAELQRVAELKKNKPVVEAAPAEVLSQRAPVEAQPEPTAVQQDSPEPATQPTTVAAQESPHATSFDVNALSFEDKGTPAVRDERGHIPAFHEFPDGDTAKNRVDMTDRGRPSANQETTKRTLSHRMTFFRNNKTGEVKGLFTWLAQPNNSLTVAPFGVTAAKGTPRKKGIQYRALIKEGWTPISSVRFNQAYEGTNRDLTISFPNEAEYRRLVAEPAIKKLEERRVVASQTEANRGAVKTENDGPELPTPSGLDYAAWFKAFSEQLPTKADGTVYTNLSKSTMADIAANAFQDPGMDEALGAFISSARIELVKDPANPDPAFMALDPQARKVAIMERVHDIIYEHYQKVVAGQSADPARSPAEILGSDDSLRFRRSQPGQLETDPGYSDSSTVANRFTAVLDALRNAGLNVKIFTDAMGNVIAEYGVYDNARNLVVLSVADANNPTLDNLVTLLHEAGHAVWAGLPIGTQARLQAALQGLLVPGFVHGAPTTEIAIEEQVVETMARVLNQEGFNPAESRGWAQKLWRTVKDIYLRSVMAIQSALFGADRVSEKVALEYLLNRTRSFLAGDSRPMSFMEWIGGGERTLAEQSDWHDSHNPTDFPEYFNWATQEMEYPDKVPDSTEAIEYNARWVKPRMTFEPESFGGATPEVGKTIDVAANKEIREVLEDLHAKFVQVTGSQMTIDDFISDVAKSTDPAENIRHVNDVLTQIGRPNVPITNIAGLTGEVFKNQAAAKAYRMLRRISARMSNARTKANKEIDSARASLTTRVSNLNKLTTDYKNAEVIMHQFRGEVREFLNEFKRNLANQGNLSLSKGQVMQQLQQLQIDQTQPIPAHYEQLVEHAFQQIAANPIKWMDTIKAAAGLTLNWGDPLLSTPTQIGLIDQIRNAATAHPELVAISHNTPESNAALVLISSFARENDHIMGLLGILESKVDADIQLVDAMLASFNSDMTDDLKEARKSLLKMGAAGIQAGKVLQKLQQIRRQNKSADINLKRNEAFVKAHDAIFPTLAAERARLEKLMGATLGPVELTHHEDLIVPPSVRSTPAEVRANKIAYSLRENDALSATEIGAALKKMKDWMAVQPLAQQGADYQRVANQVTALEHDNMNKAHLAIKYSLVNQVIGSLSSRMENTGTGPGRSAANRMRRFEALKSSFTRDAEHAGYLFASARGTAMKALGIKNLDVFNDFIWDRGLKYMETRRDLAAGPNAATNEHAVISATINYLKTDPDTRAMLAQPGAQEAVVKMFEAARNAKKSIDETTKGMGIKIRDKGIAIFRDALGSPLFTMFRGLHPRMESLFLDMRPAWLRFTNKASDNAALYQADPAAFSQGLATMFTGQVWQNFVKPLAYGKAIFSGRQLQDGTWIPAKRDNIIRAFEGAQGNAVKFAIDLWALEGSHGDSAAFLAETLDTMRNFYRSLQASFARKEQAQNNGMEVMRSPHFLQARVSEDYPAEWLRYVPLDQNSMRIITTQLAMHAAFGEDAKAIDSDFAAAAAELSAKRAVLTEIKDTVTRANPGKSPRQLRDLISAEVKRRGLDLRLLESADANQRVAEQARSQFQAWLKSSGSGLKEFGSLMTVVNLISSLAIQGPKAALINTISIFDPFLVVGLNRVGVRMVINNWKSFLNEAAGSFLQVFGHTLKTNSENVLRRMELGRLDPDSTLKLKDGIRAILTTETGVHKYSKLAKLVLHGGLPTGSADPRFSTLKPWAAFTQLGRWANSAMIDGVWTGFEDMALRAHQFMMANPQVMADPNFRFSASDLGYKRGILINDEHAFLYMQDALARYGMNLETVARNSIANQRNRSTGKGIFTTDQYRNLAILAQNEMSMEANLTNRAIQTYTNPVLRLGLPLLAWSVSRVEQLRKSLRQVDGTVGSKWDVIKRGLLMFASVLPIGLAYAWLADKYDEEIVGKKSDIRGFGEDNNFLALIEQSARMGNFGLIGDIVNTAGNFASGGDLRGVSLDSRVLFMNSTLGVLHALGAVLRQGDATYATVYRPLAQALGGSGYLQYGQIINNALSLDNEEARITARINAGNYLRAAGRELGLDVRTGRGQASLPTPAKPWVSQMVLAAMANDPDGFQKAYSKALEAAREMDKADPYDFVMRAFAASHPLKTIFRTPVSEQEYGALLGAMNERGREDVAHAVQLFNYYGERLGVKEFSGKKPSASEASGIHKPSLAEIRARAAGM